MHPGPIAPAPLLQECEYGVTRADSDKRSRGRAESQQQRMLDQARRGLGPTGFVFHLLDLQKG